MRALKRTWLILALAFVWLFWIAGPSQATTIEYTFGDSSYVWPGWEGTADPDDVNVWGIPNITGGTAIVTDGELTTVTITFAEWYDDQGGPGEYDHLYQYLRPGDLFIDLGVDQHWNYVFSFWDYSYGYNNGDRSSEGKPHLDATYPGDLPGIAYNLGTTGLSYTSDKDGGFDYYWSQDTWFAPGVSDPPRYNHPVALVPSNHSTSTTNATLTGWGSTTITFSNLNIELNGQPFAIGWTQSCANDVWYEVVPEPGTLLLLGIGLAGLLVVRRRMTTR